MIYLKYLLITIPLLLSCSSTEEKNTSKIKAPQEVKHIKLIVERGAFHYDKFVLDDTTITFYPEEENKSGPSTKYNQISIQKISKKIRDTFIKQLINKGIFDLDNTYSTNESCTSLLRITLYYDNKTKTIECNDFKRNCPQLLQFIENEIVHLHKQNLKRIYLPG